MFSKIIKLLPWLIIVYLLFSIWSLDKQNSELQSKASELSEQLKSQTIITQEKIVYKYRDTDGSAKQKELYVPSEGKIEIITPKENETIKETFSDKIFTETIEQTDGSVIKIQNKGFTFAPEVGAIYSKELEVALQIRLLYWNRYNAGLGVGHKDTLFIYGSRNISDIFKFTKNTSFQIGIGKNLKDNDTRFIFGLGVRL